LCRGVVRPIKGGGRGGVLSKQQNDKQAGKEDATRLIKSCGKKGGDPQHPAIGRPLPVTEGDSGIHLKSHRTFRRGCAWGYLVGGKKREGLKAA